jgi:hypothetical protein
MSEFNEAIGWRGPGQLSFIVYGIWKAREEPLPSMERASLALSKAVPGSEVSLFVATDQGWPCKVGVFDVEFDVWPEDIEATCRQLTMAVCQEGSELAWMMFDGVFNDVKDIFSEDWARHIYAVRGHCEHLRVDVAVADEVRHSAGWAGLVAEHRARVLELFPSLGTGS